MQNREIKYKKPHRVREPENKIDGPVALIMAIGRHRVFEEQPDLDEFLKNAVMV
jgi:hypothetical protein